MKCKTALRNNTEKFHRKERNESADCKGISRTGGKIRTSDIKRQISELTELETLGKNSFV